MESLNDIQVDLRDAAAEAQEVGNVEGNSDLGDLARAVATIAESLNAVLSELRREGVL